MTAVAGDDVILPCDVTGDPLPVIRWRKNHADVDLVGTHHKYLIDDSASLVILAADASDSARYLCVAENPAGVLNQDINLIVYGLTRFISSQPFWSAEHYISVFVYSFISILCMFCTFCLLFLIVAGFICRQKKIFAICCVVLL